MAKTSFILRALSLLGLEEILKLSEVIKEKRIPLKKAAGEDLIVWNDPPKKKINAQEEEAQVLPFPQRKNLNDFQEISDPNLPEPSAKESKEGASHPSILNAEMILWQREIAKESDGAIKKVEAFKGYQKSTQMYVVKTQTKEGSTKLRFASTDGILVNKKQA